MNNIDFNSLSDTELESFISAAMMEKERRKKEQEEIFWNRVKKAIIEYAERYGDISINYGDCYIDSDSDFSESGEIH